MYSLFFYPSPSITIEKAQPDGHWPLDIAIEWSTGNYLKVHNAQQEKSTYYIVMPVVEGQSRGVDEMGKEFYFHHK